MSFEPKDVRGVGVATVRVSAASRRDAHTVAAPPAIDLAQRTFDVVQSEANELKARKRDIDARLAELNNEVRVGTKGVRRLIPQARFEDICREQDRLKSESNKLLDRLAEIKPELRAMLVGNDGGHLVAINRLNATQQETNRLLREILAQLSAR